MPISYADRALRFARQFGVVLLLVSYLAPATACMASQMPMNAEERACCHAMQNHCAPMGMSASYGCCQQTPPGAHDNALHSQVVRFHPIAIATIRLAASLNPTPDVAGWVEHADYSPPKSPLGTVSILRI